MIRFTMKVRTAPIESPLLNQRCPYLAFTHFNLSLFLQKNLTVCILNKSGNLCFKFLNLRISSRVIHITRGESYQIIIRTEKIVALIRCLLIAAHQNLTPWLHLKPRDCIITIIFHKIRRGITLTRSNTLTEYFLKSASILLLPLS